MACSEEKSVDKAQEGIFTVVEAHPEFEVDAFNAYIMKEIRYPLQTRQAGVEGEANPDNSAQGMTIIEQMLSRNHRLTVEARYEHGEWIGTVYDKCRDKLYRK